MKILLLLTTLGWSACAFAPVWRSRPTITAVLRASSLNKDILQKKQVPNNDKYCIPLEVCEERPCCAVNRDTRSPRCIFYITGNQAR
jgi:hypothetical protein